MPLARVLAIEPFDENIRPFDAFIGNCVDDIMPLISQHIHELLYVSQNILWILFEPFSEMGMNRNRTIVLEICEHQSKRNKILIDKGRPEYPVEFRGLPVHDPCDKIDMGWANGDELKSVISK